MLAATYEPSRLTPSMSEVRYAADSVYGLAAETQGGRVLLSDCKLVSKTSRRCRVKITGDAPFSVSMKVRRTPAGNLVVKSTKD